MCSHEPTSRHSLTPEESGPPLHTPFLQYPVLHQKNQVHTLTPNFFKTLTPEESSPLSRTQFLQYPVLDQKNQVHTLTPSFFNTLTPEESCPHSHNQFLQYPTLHQKNHGHILTLSFLSSYSILNSHLCLAFQVVLPLWLSEHSSVHISHTAMSHPPHSS